MKDFIFCAVCFLIILSIIYKPKNEYEVACQVPDEYQKGWYTIDRDCYEQKGKEFNHQFSYNPKTGEYTFLVEDGVWGYYGYQYVELNNGDVYKRQPFAFISEMAVKPVSFHYICYFFLAA